MRRSQQRDDSIIQFEILDPVNEAIPTWLGPTPPAYKYR